VEASHGLDPQVIRYRIAIHLTFVVSGLIFSVMDYIADKRLVMDKAASIPEH
jgi:hypothetical protein